MSGNKNPFGFQRVRREQERFLIALTIAAAIIAGLLACALKGAGA